MLLSNCAIVYNVNVALLFVPEVRVEAGIDIGRRLCLLFPIYGSIEIIPLYGRETKNVLPAEVK